MVRYILVVIVALITGCTSIEHIKGSGVALDASYARGEGVLADNVKIYIDQLPSNCNITGLVAASSVIDGYSELAILEAELIDELRNQASILGGNAISEIVKEMVMGNTIVSSYSWGVSENMGNEHKKAERKHFASNRFQHRTASSTYLIMFRAKASVCK